jgi:hypothetical protein
MNRRCFLISFCALLMEAGQIRYGHRKTVFLAPPQNTRIRDANLLSTTATEAPIELSSNPSSQTRSCPLALSSLNEAQ